MNSKARVRLAFTHQEPDRVPLFELTIDNPTASHVLGRETLCGFGGLARGVRANQALLDGSWDDYQARRIQDHLDLWRALDIDVFPAANPIPAQPAIPVPLDDATWRFGDPADMWRIEQWSPESDTYDEVDSFLREGGLPALARLTEHLEAHPLQLADLDFTPLDVFVRELGEHDGRFVMTHADVEIGSTYCWAEHFLMGMVLDPDLIHRYLDARLRDTLTVLEEALRRGVDGVEGGYDWASARGPMFSPAMFDEFVFPRLKQITDLCHQYGVPFVKHTDGNVNSLLDGMVAAGVDGFQAIEPRAGMDIGQLKRDYGDQLTLIGNVDCSTVLVDGPEAAVREQTRAVIEAAAPGGGFLLSTSNSVHPGVQPAHYLAMLEAAREFGRYPIGGSM
jgi:hypothetical protein